MNERLSGLCHLPLYRQLALAIRARIGTVYQIGDQLPVEKELALEYKVSLITVKGALNILRKEGVISSCRGKGTFVERLRPAHHTGVLIDFDYESKGFNPYYVKLIHEISSGLDNAGITFRIYKGSLKAGVKPTRLTCQAFLRDLEKGTLGGVIVVDADPTTGWLSVLEEQGVPVLGMSSEFENAVVWNVSGCIDYSVRRLIDLGCQRIAAVGWEGFRGENHKPRDYYRKVLRNYGLPSHAHWFVSDLHPSRNGAGWEEFREIWTSSREKPDGLLVLDGELLPDVYDAVKALKIRLPRDLKIISQQVGNPKYNQLPEIEYYRQPPAAVARELVESYQALLKGERTGHVYVPILLPQSGNTPYPHDQREFSEIKP